MTKMNVRDEIQKRRRNTCFCQTRRYFSQRSKTQARVEKYAGKELKTTSKLSKNGHEGSYRQFPYRLYPDKRYFTIGEAAQLCGVKPHVLRYWE